MSPCVFTSSSIWCHQPFRHLRASGGSQLGCCLFPVSLLSWVSLLGMLLPSWCRIAPHAGPVWSGHIFVPLWASSPKGCPTHLRSSLVTSSSLSTKLLPLLTKSHVKFCHRATKGVQHNGVTHGYQDLAHQSPVGLPQLCSPVHTNAVRLG